uniref:dTDP-4-dehydrorhamnose 3,5-epimerase n=1 Tax=Candidatus Kentrum sp. UNK TaxID=2126344 RepID=A0A451AWJ0_9GAMM|nr:MAG: dTDP-4-dehydrorhamnose 3,5-epimerase [Candidatus Kentron sp. UNK]VFK70414.1 MAG: dTDP-4-dehydrorhamnose 3,5-epimerase [Candidatus Kentron sp. UNK]
MQVTPAPITGVLILEPKVFADRRGFFLESWNRKTFRQATGLNVQFVQDNHSRSQRGVLRGLHYQLTKPQGKLVRVTQGKVRDVMVDLRKSSPSFGQHVTVELSGENHRQLWIPPGCAHGFVVLSEIADFLYKTTDYYVPEDEQCIRWDDPDLDIDWRLGALVPRLSARDRQGSAFKDAPIYLL